MKHGTLTKLANEVGITPQTVWQIKEAKARPSWKTAKRLAAATNTKPEVFLEGSSEQIQAAINRWALASSMADNRPAIQEQL